MSANGRPLRFLSLVTGGWVATRVVLLWPAAPLPLAVAIGPVAAAAIARPVGPSGDGAPATAALPVERTARPPLPVSAPSTPAPVRMRDPYALALALLGLVQFGEARPLEVSQPQVLPPSLRTPPSGGRAGGAPSRWSASAWFVARGGRGVAPGFATNQLGGGQAGVRVAYALDGGRHVAAVARVSTPLAGHGREASVGLEWRPGRLPARLIAEERVPLDGGAAAPTVGIVAGQGPARLAAGFTIESYGEAGYVRRDGGEGFADGAVRVAHALATLGGIRFDLGAGSWAAVQRGARRLDVGPSLGAVVPIGHVPLRLSLDWRERIAGNAAPGSGPALTIGTDF